MTVVVASICVGFAVGIFSGLLGVGGGTLLVPIFRLGFAMDAIACTATSLFTIIPTSIAGAISHFREKTCLPKLGLAAGLGGALTSPLGVWLAGKSPDWAIMLAAACVIAYSAFTMLRKALAMTPRPKDADVAQSRAHKDGEGDTFRYETKKRDIAICAAIGLLAGVVSGYVGVGGGFIMVPLMLSLLGAPMRVVSGTSLVAVMILAVPGVVYQGLLGNVDWVAGIAVALGTVPGAALGGRLASRVPERTLRLLFAGFLFVAAVMLVANQLIY